MNEVDGKYTLFKGWKAKLGVAQNVSLIGEDFGTLTVSLTFQKDETIITAGKSQYFEMQQAACAHKRPSRWDLSVTVRELTVAEVARTLLLTAPAPPTRCSSWCSTDFGLGDLLLMCDASADDLKRSRPANCAVGRRLPKLNPHFSRRGRR